MQEIELKLTLLNPHPQLQAQLAAIPVLAQAERAGGRHMLGLHNIYFDTPDHFLHSKRVALRLRQKGSTSQPQWLQTLKIGGSDHSALSQRGEWESPVAGAALSPQLLLQTPWHTLDPQGEVFAALLPCFTTEFNRTLWQVSGADGSRIEVALDQGHVHSAGKTSPICELELELLAGQPAALFDLAQHIAASVAVLPATISKAQRGFALAQGTLLQPCPLKRISVHRGSGSPTPHAILGSAFGAICANLNTLMHTDDLAVVRQLRIGLRRFRAALRYFKPVLQHHTMPAMQLLLPLAHQLHSLEETTAAPQQRWQAMRQTLQQPQTGSQLLAICQWLEQMNG